MGEVVVSWAFTVIRAGCSFIELFLYSYILIFQYSYIPIFLYSYIPIFFYTYILKYERLFSNFDPYNIINVLINKFEDHHAKPLSISETIK